MRQYGTIEELCHIEYGTRVVKKNVKGNDYPVYGGGGESFRINKFNRNNRLVISRFGMSLKCTRFVEGKFFLNDSGLTLSPKNKNLSQEYLDKLILSLNNKIYCLGKGSAQKNLSMDKFRILNISYPSLEEQKRIVAKLDAAFVEIDKVIKISKNNLKSAETFFARKNSQAFNIFKNNSKIISINNVCKNIFAGGDAPKTSFSKIKTKQFNIPIYANAKKDKGLYGFTDVPRVDVPAITIAGRGNVGYTEIREEPFFPIVRLIVLIPNVDLISIKFLKRSILSLDILSSGSAIPQLTVPMIKNYVIPLPSLDKQKKYIEKINKIEKQVFKICDCYSKKISQLEILKSQILFNALKN